MKFNHDVITKQLFRQFLGSEDFVRTVFPHYKKEFFKPPYDSLFHHMREFFLKYNKMPNTDLLEAVIEKQSGWDEAQKECADDFLQLLKQPAKLQEHGYMVDVAEQLGRDKGVENCLMKYAGILNETNQKDVLQELVKESAEATNFAFDTVVASNFRDMDDLYDWLTTEESLVATGFKDIDEHLGGGFENKTLSVFAAPSNVGKTFVMCALAANMLKAGKKVLYISLEVADVKVRHRIAANLADRETRELIQLGRSKSDSDRAELKRHLEVAAQKTKDGDLYVKEYPTSTVNTSVVRHLLDTLQQVEDFKPDVVFVDYLNLFNSSRLGSDAGSYATIGAVCEELRGLAVLHDIPFVTATQTNRAGYGSSDPGLDMIGESMKTVHTADWVCMLMRSRELDEENTIQFLVKKSRSTAMTASTEQTFKMQVNLNKQQLIPLEDSTAGILRKVGGQVQFKQYSTSGVDFSGGF